MRTLKTLLIGLFLCGSLQAQSVVIASRVRSGASLPGTCTVSDIYFRTSGTVSEYTCIAMNTWAQLAGYALNGLLLGQGASALTAVGTAVNAVLVTSATGVPSFAATSSSLSVSSSVLNTIQGIRTADSPQFTALGLNTERSMQRR